MYGEYIGGVVSAWYIGLCPRWNNIQDYYAEEVNGIK